MFDSALAFDRYRLEVVRSWPASGAKDKLIAAIEYSLRKSERPHQPRRPEGREDFGARAGDDGRFLDPTFIAAPINNNTDSAGR